MPCTCPLAVSIALALPLGTAPAPMCPRPPVGTDVRAALIGQVPTRQADSARTIAEALRALAPSTPRRKPSR